MVTFVQPKKAAFLAAFAELGNITGAAAAAAISRTDHYNWLADPEYREAFEWAQKEANDSLRAEARRRAKDGVDEPVFYQGVECGTIRKYSDTLLIFLMKGAMPEEFRERTEQHVTGGTDNRLEVIYTNDWHGETHTHITESDEPPASGADGPGAD